MESLIQIPQANTEENIIFLFEKICHLMTFEDFQTIEFGQFSDQIQKKMLTIMLKLDKSVDIIQLLIDKMKSINYGRYAANSNAGDVNPLLHCCLNSKFDHIKLLIEKYEADIDFVSALDRTAIMYCAERGDIEITKYLYDRGAKLLIDIASGESNIYKYAKPEISKMIRKWEDDKYNRILDEKVKEIAELHQNNENLRQKLDRITSFIELNSC